MAGHGADMSGGEGSGTTARAGDGLPDWMPLADAGPTADWFAQSNADLIDPGRRDGVSRASPAR